MAIWNVLHVGIVPQGNTASGARTRLTHWIVKVDVTPVLPVPSKPRQGLGSANHVITGLQSVSGINLRWAVGEVIPAFVRAVPVKPIMSMACVLRVRDAQRVNIVSAAVCLRLVPVNHVRLVRTKHQLGPKDARTVLQTVGRVNF